MSVESVGGGAKERSCVAQMQASLEDKRRLRSS